MSIGLEDGKGSTLPVLKGPSSTANNSNNDVTMNSEKGVVESVAQYDLILLMVNMSNQESWDECKKAFLRLDPGWFLGRCAIVVTEGE